MEHDRAGHAARSTHHCMLAGYFALQGGEVLSRSCPCRHDWLCRAAAGALPLMGHMMQQGAGQGSADAAHVCRAVPAARAVPAVQRLGGRAAAALLPARPGCRPLRGAGQLGRRRAGRAARLRRACRAGGRARRAARRAGRQDGACRRVYGRMSARACVGSLAACGLCISYLKSGTLCLPMTVLAVYAHSRSVSVGLGSGRPCTFPPKGDAMAGIPE